MAKYIITIPANYRARVGGNASITVEASSPMEAKRLAVQTGVPAAVLGTPVPTLKDVPDYGAYPPDVSQYTVDPAQNPLYAGNIGGFTNFANTLGTGYDPTGGAYSAGTRGGETVPYIGGPPRSYGYVDPLIGERETLLYPANAPFESLPRILMPYDPTGGPPKRELLGGIVPPDVAEAQLNNPAFMGAMNRSANVPAYGGTDAWMPYDPSIYTPTPQEIAIAEANAAAERRIADPGQYEAPFNYSRLNRDIPQMPYDPSTRPPSYGSGMDLGGIVSPEDAEARLRDAGFVSGMADEAGVTAPVYSGSGMADDGGYDPLGGGSSNYSFSKTRGYDPYTYGETYTPPPKATVVPYDPLGASGGTLGIDRGIDSTGLDYWDIDDLDRQEAEDAAREARKQQARRNDAERAKQAALLTGPVRSWDAKLADIRVDGQGRVTLPVDMWRNAGTRLGRGGELREPFQEIGKEQIEAAIRKIAEFGIGGDTLNKSVVDMLNQAKAYYRDTPRGKDTWDKNIDGGLIPEEEGGTGRESILNSMDWKATWGDIVSGVSAPKAADVESQIPDAWANNPAGFNSYNKEQQETIDRLGLKNHKEVEDHYTAKAMEYDPSGGGETDAWMFGGPPPPPETKPPATAPSGADGMGGGETDAWMEDGAGTAKDFDFAEGAMQGFPPAPAPAAAAAAGTAGVPAWSSQDMIDDPQGFLTGAGQRRAFRNVFGEPATGVGPLASFLQRQTFPLTEAYRAQTFADMGRQEAGKYVLAPDAYPKVSFENFLTSVRDRPTGLGGAYGQALQNVNYLRGLEGSEVPTALAGVFSPEQAQNTWDARNLLQAAQRGKYSGLVSRSFRQPTQDDLFADYVLAKQDAATAGTAPQNFLNFAASRYGL